MDLQHFGVNRGTPANINTPTHIIEGQFTDSSTSEVLHDFTGENAVRWPSVLATLMPDQADEIAQLVAQRLLQMKAGV